MGKGAGVYDWKVMQNAAVAVGNGVEIDVQQVGEGAFSVLACGVVIAGTATVTFEGTVDGSNWVALLAQNVTTAATATTASASGIYRINVQGLVSVRARISAWSSGAVTVVGSLVSGGASSSAGGSSVTVGTALPAGENHIGAVGGHTAKPAATVTRPADTTAYAAGDVVNAATGAVITFSGCARAAGLGGVIQHAKLVDSANQATKGSFELWLFDTTFTPDNDNAVFTPTDAEMATVVCVINLSSSTFVGDATAGADGNVLHQSDVINRAFTCEAADTALYGALVVRNAYTPVSGETFAIQLEILQD